MSASSSRLISFTRLTFDSLGPPQGEARRKELTSFPHQLLVGLGEIGAADIDKALFTVLTSYLLGIDPGLLGLLLVPFELLVPTNHHFEPTLDFDCFLGLGEIGEAEVDKALFTVLTLSLLLLY